MFVLLCFTVSVSSASIIMAESAAHDRVSRCHAVTHKFLVAIVKRLSKAFPCDKGSQIRRSRVARFFYGAAGSLPI